MSASSTRSDLAKSLARSNLRHSGVGPGVQRSEAMGGFVVERFERAFAARAAAPAGGRALGDGCAL